MGLVSLSHQEVEDLLNDICAAKKFVEFKDNLYVLVHPSQEDLFYSRIIYARAFNKAQAMKLPTIEKAEEILKERGIFTEEDERKIKEIQSKIEGQKSVLEKTVRVPARRERLVGIIKDLESQMRDIRRKKDSILEGTCEAKAKEEQYLFLLRLNCFSYPDNELVWKTEDLFQTEKNVILRTRLYYEYVSLVNGMETPVIRYLARNTLFKIRYQNALKASAPLFDRPVFHYTVDQLNLSYWGHFYTSIYEMMPEDVPPDHVVEDDDALDAHMESIYRQRTNERAEARSRSLARRGAKSAWAHNEVIVTSSNPVYQDIEYDSRDKARAGKDVTDVNVKRKADERPVR